MTLGFSVASMGNTSFCFAHAQTHALHINYIPHMHNTVPSHNTTHAHTPVPGGTAYAAI